MSRRTDRKKAINMLLSSRVLLFSGLSLPKLKYGRKYMWRSWVDGSEKNDVNSQKYERKQMMWCLQWCLIGLIYCCCCCCCWWWCYCCCLCIRSFICYFSAMSVSDQCYITEGSNEFLSRNSPKPLRLQLVHDHIDLCYFFGAQLHFYDVNIEFPL